MPFQPPQVAMSDLCSDSLPLLGCPVVCTVCGPVGSAHEMLAACPPMGVMNIGCLLMLDKLQPNLALH